MKDILTHFRMRDLQQFKAVLTQLKARGLTTLDQALEVVEPEIEARHHVYESKTKGTVVDGYICPDCSGYMYLTSAMRRLSAGESYTPVELQNKELTIVQCKKCGFSKIGEDLAKLQEVVVGGNNA